MGESKFLYFLSGMGIGVGAALLLTPKSGADTRKAIRGSMSEGQDYIRKQGTEISEAITGTFERGKEAARKTKEGVVEAFEQGKATFRNPAAGGAE
jgi:gas vesicle protein